MKKTEKNILYWSNGQKKCEGNHKDGKYFLSNSWDKNGEIMVKDGNGVWTEWSDGQKYREKTYKDGEPDGLWTDWYVNGQKREERTYKDGELISEKCWN